MHKFNLLLFLILLVAVSCENTMTNEKVEYNCNINDVREIKNNQISVIRASLNESKPVIVSVESLKDLTIACANAESFPKEIGLLKNLEFLGLGGGDFQTLPVEIGNLHNLQNLALINTGIARLPTEFYRIRKLKFLSVFYNNIQEFEFQENLCQVNFKINVTTLGTKVKELPECLADKGKVVFIENESR